MYVCKTSELYLVLTENHTMRTHGAVNVELSSILISTLDRRLLLGKAPGAHRRLGFGLDVEAKEEYLSVVTSIIRKASWPPTNPNGVLLNSVLRIRRLIPEYGPALYFYIFSKILLR